LKHTKFDIGRCASAHHVRSSRASPVRDARLPFDSDSKRNLAVSGFSPSLRSIRAAHDGSVAQASYGERFSVHASVRITPEHERNRRKASRFHPSTAIYAACAWISQPPDYGHTPRKLPRFRAISRIIADCALGRRSVIIQQHTRVCQGFFKSFFGIFYEISGVFFVHYILCPQG